VSVTAPDLKAGQLRALAKAGELEETRYKRVTAGALSSNALLAVLGIAFLLPLIWVVLASIDSHAGAGVRVPNPTIGHYSTLAHESRLRPFYNSFYLAGVSTLVSTVLGLFAAYALSRRHIPFKRTLMLVILFMSGLPVTMLLVPVYQMFVQFQWLNSMFWTSMFIAASSLPFTIRCLASSRRQRRSRARATCRSCCE
jgi:multiple sugar transport system permease protein